MIINTFQWNLIYFSLHFTALPLEKKLQSWSITTWISWNYHYPLDFCNHRGGGGVDAEATLDLLHNSLSMATINNSGTLILLLTVSMFHIHIGEWRLPVICTLCTLFESWFCSSIFLPFGHHCSNPCADFQDCGRD